MPVPDGAPIPSTTKKGMDNPQLQARVAPDDSPVKEAGLPDPIMQGELQPPLEVMVLQAPLTPEERALRKARLAVQLDRGMIQDRLSVPLPADVHGEWVRNDALEIHRLETLGFKVDTEFAKARALHSDGSNAAVVGDVIFMITSRENKEIIDEIRHEQFLAQNAPRKSKEEKDFEAKMQAELGGAVPAFTESRTTGARRENIEAALREVDKQTALNVVTKG